MKKRYLLGLFPLLTLLVFLMTSGEALAKPQAHARIPLGVNCSGLCSRAWYWHGGNTYGEWESFMTTGPTLRWGGSHGVVTRFVELHNFGKTYPRINLGEEIDQDSGSPSFCHFATGSTPTAGLYIEGYDNLGNLDVRDCVPLDTRDDNQFGTLRALRDSNGWNVIIDGFTYTPPLNQEYLLSSGFPTSFNEIKLFEQILDSNIQGHMVWGVPWQYSQWADGAFVYHYQTVDPVLAGTGNPPQFFWPTHPSQSSTGGFAISCDYDSGGTCTLYG